MRLTKLLIIEPHDTSCHLTEMMRLLLASSPSHCGHLHLQMY